VDTEGHDWHVLAGAVDLLRSRRIGLAQFEYNHRWVYARRFLKDVFDLVEGMPYQVGRLTGAGVELTPRWHPELDRFFQSNFVLVENSMVAHLEHVTGSFDAANTYVAR
jgi:hypothetical protein